MIQTNHLTSESAQAILLGMIAQQYQLYIERRDPRRNMARFYTLSIEETLFGRARLVRRWGRIGTIGRVVQHSFDDEGDAVQLFLELLRAKRNAAIAPGRSLNMQKRPRLPDGADHVRAGSRVRSARRRGTPAAHTSRRDHGRAVPPAH